MFAVLTQPKDGEPVIRLLTAEPVAVIDNHFRIPIGKTDMLKAPDHFPCPVYRYTLSEISVVWSMYGGRDFESSGTYSLCSLSLVVSMSLHEGLN